jgi:hypothetical protein
MTGTATFINSSELFSLFSLRSLRALRSDSFLDVFAPWWFVFRLRFEGRGMVRFFFPLMCGGGALSGQDASRC